VRETTLKSTAPTLVYEEANLVKRAIRDHYSKDVDEILVEGEAGYRVAKDFMRSMQPSHSRKVQHYRGRIPLLHRYQVEQQLDQMHSNVVHLKSGGYIVLSPTEALVAIDVNSGRSTREHNIEETALKTNLEASDEIARQLRLRDLAGLIVIDYIDMSESKHSRQVERRLKESLKADRARIQVGRISGFGLLEMSRQRMRPSLFEASMVPCAACSGTGFVRSTESTALHVLRAIEEEGIRGRAEQVTVKVPLAVALYVLNNKRATLREIEQRYVLRVMVLGDPKLVPPDYEITIDETRGEQRAAAAEAVGEEISSEAEVEIEAEVEAEPQEETRKGRRRRRRRKRTDGEEQEVAATLAEDEAMRSELEEERQEAAEEGTEAGEEDGARRRRRRGRRGGRRRRATAEAGEGAASEEATASAIEGEPSAPGEVETSAETGSGAAEEQPEAAERPVPAGVLVPAEAEEALSLAAAESEPPHEAAGEPEGETAAPVLQAPAADAASSYSAGGDAPPVQVHIVGGEQKEESEETPKRRGWWQRKLG
jgi:ribonuclease E